MVSASDFDTLVIILVCGVIGIFFSMIATTLHNSGYFVDALANMAIDIAEVRVIVIVLWFIFGIIIAATRR